MRKAKKDKNLKFIKGKGWYIDFTFNKKRIRKFGGYTKEQARAYLAKLKIAAREKEFQNPIVLSAPKSLLNISGLRQLKVNGDCPGIYFLTNGSEVVYIGQSRNIWNRIVKHIQEGKKEFNINQTFYLPARLIELNSLEKKYIERFNPKYNKEALR